MPTYDYACKACDHRFEAFQSMRDDALVTCPSCGVDALQRLIGAGAGLVFKGSGFYLTDYKKTGSSTASSTSTASDSASASTAPPAASSTTSPTPTAKAAE
ncbi:MAG: zinc ribbon domain-containing protein [Bacteroidia bacterium]|nr:zinc ribbon domain-containing protein [Bacteroidia bacterium]